MDRKRSRFDNRKPRHDIKDYSRSRQSHLTRNSRQRRRQNHNRSHGAERFSTDQPNQTQLVQVSTDSIHMANDAKEIPGYIYDAVKKRYFKEQPGQQKPLHDEKKYTCQDNQPKPTIKQGLVHYLQKRESSASRNSLHFKRKGLEHWARHAVNRKSFGLMLCPTFRGSLTSLTLSPHNGKLLAVAKIPGLGHNIINVYDIKSDKKKLIIPHMCTAVLVNEVTHITWNPWESMNTFFLFSLFGRAEVKGSAVVCKFKEHFESCEVTKYPLPSGAAWHCSWCSNPQYSNFLGIAGSKQAALVDFEKQALLCKIPSPSDVFSIEFGHKSPVAYLGCRNGDVMRADIRTANTTQSKLFNVSGKARASATCMKVLQDENYLMASSIDGMIKTWDVRMSKPVKEYYGNVNETKRIPFVMDSSENLMASAGIDGKTRLWSVQTCELLQTIEYPLNCSTNEIDIPPVCLGENWGLRSNLMALSLGIADKIKLYF